jgi:hypothetical protein
MPDSHRSQPLQYSRSLGEYGRFSAFNGGLRSDSCEGQIIAEHARCLGRDQLICNPWHSLPILEKSQVHSGMVRHFRRGIYLFHTDG